MEKEASRRRTKEKEDREKLFRSEMMQWRQEETEVVKKRKQLEEQFHLAKRMQSSEHRAQLHDPTKNNACRLPLSTKSEEAPQLHDPTTAKLVHSHTRLGTQPLLSTKAVQNIHEFDRVKSIKVKLARRRDESEQIRVAAIQAKAAERREGRKLQQEPETGQEL